MAGKKPGRPRKERPEGATENDKIWGVRGVDIETRKIVTTYASLNDMSVSDALTVLVEAGMVYRLYCNPAALGLGIALGRLGARGEPPRHAPSGKWWKIERARAEQLRELHAQYELAWPSDLSMLLEQTKPWREQQEAPVKSGTEDTQLDVKPEE